MVRTDFATAPPFSRNRRRKFEGPVPFEDLAKNDGNMRIFIENPHISIIFTRVQIFRRRFLENEGAAAKSVLTKLNNASQDNKFKF